MSKLLRLPLALLVVLSMLLLWAGTASADGEGTDDVVSELTPTEPAESTTPAPTTTPAAPTTTSSEELRSQTLETWTLPGESTSPSTSTATTTSASPTTTPGGGEGCMPEGDGGPILAQGGLTPVPEDPEPPCVPTCEEFVDWLVDLLTTPPDLPDIPVTTLTAMDSPSDFLALPEAAQEELLALFTDAFPDFPEFEDPADALAAFLKLLLCSEIPGGEEPPPTTTPPTKPITQPTVVTYANCDDARARGAAPVYAGQPGYGPHLDSDSDGIGCEQETVTPVAYTTTTSPQLAYTGFDAAPFVAGGAALVALGTLTVLAGSRRRS